MVVNRTTEAIIIDFWFGNKIDLMSLRLQMSCCKEKIANILLDVKFNMKLKVLLKTHFV